MTHRLISWLDKKSTAILTTTRDKVVVPAHVYVADKAIPDSLAVVAAGSVVVASGIAKVSGYFTRLAEKSAAKSLALRVQSFVRVQLNPNIQFVPIPPADGGRVRAA